MPDHGQQDRDADAEREAVAEDVGGFVAVGLHWAAYDRGWDRTVEPVVTIRPSAAVSVPDPAGLCVQAIATSVTTVGAVADLVPDPDHPSVEAEAVLAGALLPDPDTVSHLVWELSVCFWPDGELPPDTVPVQTVRVVFDARDDLDILAAVVASRRARIAVVGHDHTWFDTPTDGLAGILARLGFLDADAVSASRAADAV